CRLYIFTPEQEGWYQEGALTVTNPPITVLNSSTNGWRDLAVQVAGGGARSSSPAATGAGRSSKRRAPPDGGRRVAIRSFPSGQIARAEPVRISAKPRLRDRRAQFLHQPL